MRHYLLLVSFFLVKMTSSGQNYHAVQGSSYAGTLGVGNNPASIVNTPFAWDVNVFSFQVKAATNAFTVHKYSLLTPPSKAEYGFDKGYYSRKANANFNINLLNARIAINRQTAIAAGINIRGYTRAKTNPYNFVDTLDGMEQFFRINNNNLILHGDVISSNWLEIFGTYSRTIFDDYRGRLNAGVTLKVSKGLGGANGGLENIKVQPVQTGENIGLLTTGNARYGYSSNIDGWDNDKSTGQNIRDFVANAEGGMSVDIGVEYLIKPSGFVFFGEEDEKYYDYDWKIGLSLLDLGFNQYKYSKNSRVVSGIRDNMTGELLDQKFNNISNIEGFNDSLADVVNSMRTLSGKFNVINPARLVLNVDRFLFDAFYINGDLSVNLSSLVPKRMYAKEMNLLTVTPRWETRSLGFYMPIQYNTEKKFWIGAAVKAGPLLIGLHNLAYLFAKNKIQNGGGYLALVIRPGKKNRMDRDKRRKSDRIYDCPTF